MAARIKPRIDLKDAKIRFKNFSGRNDQYHKPKYSAQGEEMLQRNIVVEIDEATAMDLRDKGFYVPCKKDKHTGEPFYTIKINIGKFFKNDDGLKPKIVKIVGNEGRRLNENTIDGLDHMKILKSDITFTGSPSKKDDWDYLNAWLEIAYVTVEDYLDNFAKDYADLNIVDDDIADDIDLECDVLTF